jgi:hypothetical protein
VGADAVVIDPEREALEAGLSDVRESFARWNRNVGAIVRVWMGTSLLVGIALLLATWGVSTRVDGDGAAAAANATFTHDETFRHAAHLFSRNALVLAMHALICVAGYMALNSMPLLAAGYTGWKRRIHLAAGPIAIAFVTLMTISSFTMQAWSLGTAAPGIAAAYGLETWELLLRVAPHALPELTAVFLPLGAWLVLAARRQHSELLAASVLATAVAIPLLVIATIVEEWIAPILLLGGRGG